MLWYLALVGLIKDRLTDDRMRWIARLVLALAIVLVMRRDVSNWFSIAWWPPYFLYVGAHPFALYLGLVGIVLATFGIGIVRHLSLVIWFAASLIHPAIGLFVIVFYWLATFQLGNWRAFLAEAFFAVVLPFAILAIVFRPEKPLTAAEFVDAYVITTHPFHYHLAEFATLTKYPWWVSFALVVSLMGLVGIIAAARRNRPLRNLSVLFALAYVGCIAIQYLGSEVWPSKTIAALGPSRFTFLGYYMLALLAVLLACDLWPARWASTSVIRRTVAPWLERLRPVHVVVVTLLAVVLLTVLLKDDLQGEVRAHYGGFYDWVDQNTKPDDVFSTPFNEPLHRELPVIGRRAVVASQCFPFREDAIREHVDRLSLVYGTNEELARSAGKDQIRRRLTFYRTLGPDDFLRIANQLRLDYVVVEADYRSQFEGYPVRYEDDSVAVYDVASFRDN
jgi:hypothetical protein